MELWPSRGHIVCGTARLDLPGLSRAPGAVVLCRRCPCHQPHLPCVTLCILTARHTSTGRALPSCCSSFQASCLEEHRKGPTVSLCAHPFVSATTQPDECGPQPCSGLLPVQLGLHLRICLLSSKAYSSRISLGLA